MAIDDFVPEIWASEILHALSKRLVYGQLGVINRDYEGDIAEKGDTVHITSITDPSISTYTDHSSTLTYAALADTDQTLVVNVAKSFSFQVTDIEKRQANNASFITEAATRAAYGIADAIDQYVASTLYTAVNDNTGAGNDLGAKTVDISDNTGYGLLVDLRTTLNRDNVPTEGRWVIVPPEMYAALLQDNRFVDASASGSTDALRNGFVGRAAGFDVYESNNTPDPTASTYAVIAGHPWACTFAQQINSIEALRLETVFADGIRGLALYGAKVVRPTCLAMASVTVQA